MNRNAGFANPCALGTIACVILLTLVSTPLLFAQRTQLKPGRNFFTPQQDVELGEKVAKDAEQKLPMLNNQRVDAYVNRLGKRLAGVAPGEKYPYQFKTVNDSSINAFALPGGFLYINRGTIEAADNEAQLAGVVAHEIAHVALRHGTNQASNAQLAQAPLAVLGAILGNRSTGAAIAQIGSEFLVGSVLLKYSRDAERQSDLMGTQILYDCNYDPHAMATFFEKLDTGGRGTDFFSSHPNPDNRMQNIRVEIGKLGPLPGNRISDSSEFRSIQKYLKSLPPAPKSGESSSRTSDASEPIRRPERPSSRVRTFDGENIRMSYPDNWKEYESNQSISFAPEGGANSSGLAYGFIMSIFSPRSDGSGAGLQAATNQLIESLRSSNPDMRVARDQGSMRVGGKSALSRMLSNNSPVGGQERDWLVTVMIPDGLLYFIFVAPEAEFAGYQQTFQQILNSVRLYD